MILNIRERNICQFILIVHILMGVRNIRMKFLFLAVIMFADKRKATTILYHWRIGLKIYS